METLLSGCENYEYKQKEIDRLKKIISYLPKIPTQPYEKELVQTIQKLQAENAKLRECVEWYADKANQIAPIYPYDGRNKPGADFTQPYRMDSGKRARQCLKELNEEL
jgi:hypothetical protein